MTDLFDAKGNCQICSTSTVQRRIDRGSYASHAREHRRAGDPVELRYSAGIRTAGTEPDQFKIITAPRTTQPTFCGNRDEGCGASLTPADFEAGACTQCQYPLGVSGLPLEHQLLLSLREIQSQRDAEVE